MKIFAVVVLLMCASTSFGQNCLNYYLLQNNRRIDNTIYNKNGQVFGKQIYSVSGVSAAGDATTANIRLEMIDKNGNVIANTTNSIKCKGGIMMMNMKMLMPQQQQVLTAGGKGESAYVEYPANMKVGDKLKNASFEMDLNRAGMKQHVSMLITNRKVLGKEKVTTKAGAWDCYKISYTGKILVDAMGMQIPVDLVGTEWFAPSFGMIKTKSNFGSSEITAIR